MSTESKNFLHQEYSESYEQLRFYDERSIGLVKFSISISSIVLTTLFGLYKILKTDIAVFWVGLTSVSSIVFFCLLIVLFALVQNRLYFVFMARQLNALRKHLLKSNPEFTDNQLYTTTSFAAFMPYSSHLMMIYGISLISSVYFAISMFSSTKYASIETPFLCIVVSGIIMFFVQVFISASYLKRKGNKSSDEAIHSSSN